MARETSQSSGNSAVRASVLDAMRDAVLLMDMSGEILLVNPAFEEITGRDQGFAVGKNAGDLINSLLDEKEAERAHEQWRHAIEGKSVSTYVHHLIDSDGDAHWVACDIARMDDNQGLIVVLRDVTELRDAQETLAEERNLLRTLIDNIPDRIYVKDLDGKFRLCNNALAMLVGARHPREIVGKTDFDIHPEERAKEYHADEQELVRSGYPVSKSETVVDAEGVARKSLATKIPLRDDSGEVVAIAGIGRDLTELKEAQERLRQAEEEYRGLMDNLTIGVFRSAPDEIGAFLQANPAAARIFGYDSPRELLKVPLSELYADRKDHQTAIKELKENGVVENHEVEFRRRDGSAMWGSCSVRAQYSADGSIECVDGVVEDITERRTMEQAVRISNMRLSAALEELKKTQQRIIEQERLSAVGQMASGIAHDFNNALMPILGFSEFMLRNPDTLDDKESAVDMLRDIHTAAKDATNTIRRLRDFYKPSDTREHHATDINDLVDTAINLTQPKWKEEAAAAGISIKIKTDFQATSAITGSESQLREVVTNLILNACDAMPEGGTVTLETRSTPEWVILKLSDTGVGMSDEIRRRCFEPFFSTKGASGTGMGLAVAYGIVRQHSGRIDIYSDPGKGTTISIRFPAETGQAGQAPVAVEPSDLPAMRILFIDDEPWSRKLVERVLKSNHHDVVLAQTGTDGLEKFSAGKFDLVITDRAMPDMSGDQVAEAIKRKDPGVPVILLTGFGDLMKETGEKPEHVDLILSKPVAAEELMHGLAKVVR